MHRFWGSFSKKNSDRRCGLFSRTGAKGLPAGICADAGTILCVRSRVGRWRVLASWQVRGIYDKCSDFAEMIGKLGEKVNREQRPENEGFTGSEQNDSGAWGLTTIRGGPQGRSRPLFSVLCSLISTLCSLHTRQLSARQLLIRSLICLRLRLCSRACLASSTTSSSAAKRSAIS